MDTDLATRLDRSIGPAPDGPDPLADVLAQGHRVVRRRRLAGTTASVAAVLVVVGGAALATGGDSGRAAPPVASTSSPTISTPTAAPSSAAEPVEPTPSQEWTWGRQTLAAWDPGAGVVIAPGAVVTQRIDNYLGLTAPQDSVALALTRGQRMQWVAMTWDDGGSAAAYIAPEQADGTLRSWALEAIDGPVTHPEDVPADSPTPQGEPADGLVAFVGTSEELTSNAGATVLEQRAGVDVGKDFAGPGDRTAAARVRTAEGEEVFVLVRAFAGESTQVISVPVGGAAGADLDAFLAFTRDAYAGGGGLL